jgi:hypothetical protein
MRNLTSVAHPLAHTAKRVYDTDRLGSQRTGERMKQKTTRRLQMTSPSHAAGTTRPADRPQWFLSERENTRAVELIEAAERGATSCLCGSHMLAVAHDDGIWLECAGELREKDGLAGFVARLMAFTHSRRKIMEIPVD